MIEVPVVRPVGYRDDWVLQERWVFDHTDRVGVVPKGFHFDLASIPKWARSVIQKNDRRTWGPALEHDWRYRHQLGRRADADKNFYLSLRANGMSRDKAALAWVAVRVGGGCFWRKRSGG